MDEIQNEIEKTKKLLELLKERFARGELSERTFLGLKAEYETKLTALQSKAEKSPSEEKEREDVVEYCVVSETPKEVEDTVVYQVGKEKEEAVSIEPFYQPAPPEYTPSAQPTYYPSIPKSTSKTGLKVLGVSLIVLAAIIDIIGWICVAYPVYREHTVYSMPGGIPIGTWTYAEFPYRGLGYMLVVLSFIMWGIGGYLRYLSRK